MRVCNEIGSLWLSWVPQLKSAWYQKMTNLPWTSTDLSDFDIGMMTMHSSNLKNIDSIVSSLPIIVFIMDPIPTILFNRHTYWYWWCHRFGHLLFLRSFENFHLHSYIPQALTSIINHSFFVPKYSNFEGVLNVTTDIFLILCSRSKVWPSHSFGLTNNGAWFLSPNEVLVAWDIPGSFYPLKPSVDLVTNLVPVKSILVVFDDLTPLITSKVLPVGSPSLPPLKLCCPNSCRTYLPSLKKWLSLA